MAGGVPDPRIAQLRRSYTSAGLAEADLADDWLGQFSRWFGEAVAAGLPEPNAMILATATADGRPSARAVLLKGYDDRGLAFFTNYTSRKAAELDANPYAALCFVWLELHRQVRVEGRAERLAVADTAAYFRTRPRGAQLGAWASPQSAVISSRRVLEDAQSRLAAEYSESRDVPVPEHWGGLRLVPAAVEFWQGRPDRLHDRLRYRRADGGWIVERLAP